MNDANAKPVYHKLIVEAEPTTKIWLACDCWHLVQTEIGTLKASVLRGRYFVEFDKLALNGVAYPIELFGELRIARVELEEGPACQRQAAVILDGCDLSDDEMPMPDGLAEELERRKLHLEANPDSLRPWDEVYGELKKRYGA